ncbi:RluA family pseudouridine synthase [Candidatus Kaiserbacteria bacterium]|nr:RluA family pseudouridine synthase [Candidatus Kaiserbacteria bacterium]
MQRENDAGANKEPVVIYEDDNVLVINKPYGWLTHEDGRKNNTEEVPTVVEWFLTRVPEAAGVGEPALDQAGNELNRSGVVHRLDRETSGVLILAKTQTAYEHLKHAFKERLVKKEYRAFIYGRLNDRWGTINRPIGRSPRDPRMRSAQPGAKGQMREAVTDFERIGMGEYEGEAFSYVKLKPQTGRTHQLRVHLKALDRPIVMDELYGAHMIERSKTNLGLNRLALHAHILELPLPGAPNDETQRFIAPVPQVFEEAAEKLEEQIG